MRKRTVCCVPFVILTLLLSCSRPSTLHIQNLRCAYRTDPSGIDDVAPALSWVLTSEERDQVQTAYQVMVSSSAEGRGDLWNSGKVISDQSAHVHYAGRPLQSRMHCFWKVRVWDQDGRASAWSETAAWTMGLLDSADWRGAWIGLDTNSLNENKALHLPPAPYLRTSFETDRSVTRATLYVTALGLFECAINGARVGEDWFTPGWTDYHQRVHYLTYDVTSMIRPGENVICAILADGWYAGYVGYALLVGHPRVRNFYGESPALLAQLEITYADGSGQVIATGPDWKAATGPIREASILMGETYDARLEMAGWNMPGFNDAAWHPVQEVKPEHGALCAYPAQTVQQIEEILPVEVTSPEDGVYVFNLGQNIAGKVRLKVRGDAGDRVVLRFGEMLHADGTVMTENLRRARATDTYILKGDPDGEVWTPRFTYHGFQYVEVTGYPGRPGPAAITGLVMHSDTPPAGSFQCAEPLVNQLYSNIVWTQRANYFDIPTDCPQRDERMGWTGDAQIYAMSAAYNMDVSAFFRKWMRDLNDAQRPEGYYPNFAPIPFHRTSAQHFYFSPGWMDAGIICPWVMWRMYGDTTLIRRYYRNMAKQIAFYRALSDNYLCPEDIGAWGDWLSFGIPTSHHFIGTAYFAYDTRLMADMADAIGETDDAEAYRALFAEIQSALLDKYWADGRFSDDTQTAYALAIDFGLLPENLKAQAAGRLAQLIDENDGLLTTGFLGTKHLLPALTETGHEDLAYALLTATAFPSWGYEIVNGANTIWEHWDSYTLENGFKPGMNSFSHYAFGAVNEWLFGWMAGICAEAPGFKRIMIRPHIGDGSIRSASATYASIYGEIASSWKIMEDTLRLHVRIPVNTTATVFLPAASTDHVWMDGRAVQGGKTAGDRIAVTVGSGTYRFDALISRAAGSRHVRENHVQRVIPDMKRSVL